MTELRNMFKCSLDALKFLNDEINKDLRSKLEWWEKS